MNNQENKLIFSEKIDSLKLLNRYLKNTLFSNARFFILVDENTFEFCLNDLVSIVEPLQEAELFEIPSGESQKALSTAENLWTALQESEADRNAVIVNLGGGVISDLGGFVAATYKRGIRYINIPTTLLGMVDAAIGGKTAVDLNQHKNHVGAFYHPMVTCIYPSFLKTLSLRELKSGAAEMIKTALLSKKEFWEALRQMPIEKAAQNQKNIREAVVFKRQIVEQDFEEQNIRKILNFGHTIGHAIESYSLRSEMPLLHGEAVALGMLAELFISIEKLDFPKEEYKEIFDYITQNYTFPKYFSAEIDEILSFLKNDKKNFSGKINACLLRKIGVPAIDVEITEEEARKALIQLTINN